MECKPAKPVASRTHRIEQVVDKVPLSYRPELGTARNQKTTASTAQRSLPSLPFLLTISSKRVADWVFT